MLAYKMHTTGRGGKQWRKSRPYPVSPMETVGAAGGLGLVDPCLLAEPRPSGLGASPPSGSPTASVPASHPG